MAYDTTEQKPSAYSKIIRAGKKRTYFFDIKESRVNDYYLIITESRKRFDDNGYDKSKLFVYKEDLNKFVNTLTDVVNHVKVELMPNYNFDEFNHESISPDYAKPVENTQTSVEVKTDEIVQEEKLEQPIEIQDSSNDKNVNSAHETVDNW